MNDQIKGSKTPSWVNVLIYSKIKERAKGLSYMRPGIILEELKKVIRVPKTFHYPILKQMEEEGLIKRINHQKYEITDSYKEEKTKEINAKLKELQEVKKRTRLLTVMEEVGLIEKAEGTKFKILTSNADEKLESMGNWTLWY